MQIIVTIAIVVAHLSVVFVAYYVNQYITEGSGLHPFIGIVAAYMAALSWFLPRLFRKES